MFLIITGNRFEMFIAIWTRHFVLRWKLIAIKIVNIVKIGSL